MKKIILSSFVVLGLSTAAFAQAAADFATVDADVSGGVSWAEAAAVLPNLTEDAFKTADADASGELSVEEYAAVAVAPAN